MLVVGGGLLALDTAETRLSADLPAIALAGLTTPTQFQLHLPGTLASCRLESLLHAAPLHLLDRVIPQDALEALPPPSQPAR